jgi:hypothetical protein
MGSMKRLFLAIALTLSMPITSYTAEYHIDFPDLRVATGVYYDYLTIETADGNVWLLNDNPTSKYIDENGKAIFHNGENVLILFDTMATTNIEDDMILDVHSLEY